MLEELFNNGRIWQARQTQTQNTGRDTGFAPLNQALVSHGWPDSGVVEIQHNTLGIGEISLLLPYLKQLSNRQQWQLWISPPMQVNGAALLQAGIDLRYLLVINAETASDILWATEEAVKSPWPHCVLSWPQNLTSPQLRRLHLCAAQYQTTCFVFRKPSPQHSVCALKLRLHATAADTLQIDILKQRQGPAGQTVSLQIPRTKKFRYPRPALSESSQ